MYLILLVANKFTVKETVSTHVVIDSKHVLWSLIFLSVNKIKINSITLENTKYLPLMCNCVFRCVRFFAI